jgi:H+/Cl- antiporter ClcA
LLSKACSGVGTVARWSKNGVLAVTSTVAGCTSAVLNKLAEFRRRLRSLRHVRRPLLLALAVGGLAVVITLVAPTWVTAIVSGLGGAGVALAVQAGLWLRRHLGTLLATSN